MTIDKVERALTELDTAAIKVIVFDLDGTLYEDTEHFDYYASCLAEELEEEKREDFFHDLAASRVGEHVLRLGRVYDVENDNILEITPLGEIKKAWNWQEEPLSESTISELYPAKINCNMTDMLYLGDGWWPPAACAFHYGVESTERCYQKTKEWLAANDDFLTPRPELNSALTALKRDYTLILATNSDAADAKRILNLLQLDSFFTETHTSCDKPAQSRQLFTKIIARNNIIAEELLTVGDNFLNDIAPARMLGCQSILLDPFNSFAAEQDTGPILNNLSELSELLNRWIEQV